MSNLNWPAIHSAYKQHIQKKGMQPQPTPQPQAVNPMHAIAVHAMGLANTQPGENHKTMLIRALDQALKREQPDVSKIHQQPSAQPA